MILHSANGLHCFPTTLFSDFNDTANVNLLVTDFGAPAENLSVNISLHGNPYPSMGIIPHNSIVTTDKNGIASFTLQINNAPEERIPYPRRFDKKCPRKCNMSEIYTNISIDGQLAICVQLQRYWS